MPHNNIRRVGSRNVIENGQSRASARCAQTWWLVEIRRSDSHRTLEKNGVRKVFSHHDSVDLGGLMMARVARQFGYSLAELRQML